MQEHIGRIDLGDIRVTGVMRELTAYRTWSVGIGTGNAEQAALAVALRRAYAEDVLVLDDQRVRLAGQARADFRAWVRKLGGARASALLDAAVRHVEYHWRPDGMRAACAPEARTWRRCGPERFEIVVRHDAFRRGPALTVVAERAPDGWRVTSIAGRWPTVTWHAVAAAR
jgi:hypothetical protein